MHCGSEWENWKFRVQSICVGSGVSNMRFSGSRITAHSGFFRSLPTQVEITLSTSIKQTTAHHGQVSGKCKVSRGAEGNPVLCGNIQLWMLLYTCPPRLVYDMASKYCNIKGKRKSPPPDYSGLLPALCTEWKKFSGGKNNRTKMTTVISDNSSNLFFAHAKTKTHQAN